MQQHVPLALRDAVSGRSVFPSLASAGRKSPCISVLQDEWRPLKKRPLRTGNTPVESHLVANPPNTSSGSGRYGRVEAFECYQKVDVKCTALSSQAERVSSESGGAPQLIKIDLDALTYYPPRPSSVRNFIIKGSISKPLRQCSPQAVRQYKRVRFSLPSWRYKCIMKACAKQRFLVTVCDPYCVADLLANHYYCSCHVLYACKSCSNKMNWIIFFWIALLRMSAL